MGENAELIGTIPFNAAKALLSRLLCAVRDGVYTTQTDGYGDKTSYDNAQC